MEVILRFVKGVGLGELGGVRRFWNGKEEVKVFGICNLFIFVDGF